MIDLKETPYWHIFSDIAMFMKEFFLVNGSDEYWDSVISKAGQISDFYKDSDQGQYVDDLLVATIEDLNRRFDREVKHATLQ